MIDLTIKEIVKDNFVYFSHYKAGILYYTVDIKMKKQIYLFPVPIEDIGEATFNKTEKAILLMRYVRKALKENTFIEIENEEA